MLIAHHLLTMPSLFQARAAAGQSQANNQCWSHLCENRFKKEQTCWATAAGRERSKNQPCRHQGQCRKKAGGAPGTEHKFPCSLWTGPCLLVSMYWNFCLPEAPLHLLTISEPGSGSSVLRAASSSEPLHLQHEKPGAQRFNMETADWAFISGHRLSAFFCRWLQVLFMTGHLAFPYGVCFFNFPFCPCDIVAYTKMPFFIPSCLSITLSV